MYQPDHAPTTLPTSEPTTCYVRALSEVLDSITGTRQSIPMEAHTLIADYTTPVDQSGAWSYDISYTL